MPMRQINGINVTHVEMLPATIGRTRGIFHINKKYRSAGRLMAGAFACNESHVLNTGVRRVRRLCLGILLCSNATCRFAARPRVRATSAGVCGREVCQLPLVHTTCDNETREYRLASSTYFFVR